MKSTSPALSSIWLVVEKISSMAITLTITLLLARYLGPESFGDLNYLVALVTLISPLAAFGLNGLITREIVLNTHRTNQILGTATIIRLCTAFTSSLLMWICMSFFVEEKYTFDFTLLLVANVFTSFLVFDYWLQAHVANQYAVKVRLFILIFASFLKLICIFYDATLNVFIYVSALEISMQGVGFILIYYLKGKGLKKLVFCWRTAKELLSQSWLLLLSGLAAVVYLKIDQIMLGHMTTSEQVGLYAVASRLSEVWYFFPVAIVSSFFPKLLDVKGIDKHQYHLQLQKLNDFLFVGALLLSIFVTVFVDPIIDILFGSAYINSADILIIHIWAGLFIFMRALLSKWLLAEGLLRFSLISQLAGAIMNVAMNWLLIPFYGGVGAAIATVISYAAASYLALLLNTKTWPMAKIMTKSFILPFRLLRKGVYIYSEPEKT